MNDIKISEDGGKVAEQLQTRVDSQGNAVAQVTRGR